MHKRQAARACTSGRPERSAWYHCVRCADRLEPVRRASSMFSPSSGSPPSSSPGSPALTSTVRLWTPPATPLCPPSTRSPLSASDLRILARRHRQLGRWWEEHVWWMWGACVVGLGWLERRRDEREMNCVLTRVCAWCSLSVVPLTRPPSTTRRTSSSSSPTCKLPCASTLYKHSSQRHRQNRYRHSAPPPSQIYLLAPLSYFAALHSCLQTPLCWYAHHRSTYAELCE